MPDDFGIDADELRSTLAEKEMLILMLRSKIKELFKTIEKLKPTPVKEPE